MLWAPSQPISQEVSAISSAPSARRRVDTTLSSDAVNRVSSTVRSTFYSQIVQELVEHALGIALRNHKTVGICGRQSFDGEMSD
jgi:hypothetical protein